MKKFRFPLQPLVTLRSYEEARAKEALAASIQAHAQAVRDLANLRNRIAALASALTSERTVSFAAASAGDALAHYRSECARIVTAERAVAEAEKLVQRRRGEYLKAHRGVEILDRLDDAARREHRAALQREEQAGYDERASRAGYLNTSRAGAIARTFQFES